jgi:hypothetical protein
VSSTLVGIAGVAADVGRLDRTAELLGAVEAAAGSSGVPLVPADEAARTRLIERSHEVLGTERSDELRSKGSTRSVTETLACVLDPGYLVV